jgi:hypothetical protein
VKPATPLLVRVSRITGTSALAKEAAVSRSLPTLQYLETVILTDLLPCGNQVSVEADWVIDNEVVPVVVDKEVLNILLEVFEEVDCVQDGVEASAPCVLVHLESSSEAESSTLGVIEVDLNTVEDIDSLPIGHWVKGLLKVLSNLSPVSWGLKGLETVTIVSVQPCLNFIELVLGESAHSLSIPIISKI